tara:strand:- start:4180 stop:5073 length:894 start_codon:yes stop_codon:yes gene_type:complete
MRNELEYDYFPLDYPNLLQEVRKGQHKIEGLSDSIMLLELLNKVAKKYPNWEIIVNYCRLAVVYENKEEIGKLSVVGPNHYSSGGRGGSFRYKIYGPRVAAGLKSDTARYTQNVASAMTLIRKLFGARTMTELYEQSWANADLGLRHVGHTAETKKAVLKSKIAETLRTLIRSDWELARKTALASGVPEATLDDYTLYDAESAEIAKFRRALKGGGVCAVQYKDGYVINSTLTFPSGDLTKPSIFCSNTINPGVLTQEDRKKIGMLKLVAPNTYVPDVGYREGEGTFLIAREAKHDE